MDDTAVELEQAWREHRRHVLDIAFRMLGNLGEAEDVVQETFARLVRANLDEIDDVGGWLVVVASRLCLDRLRSERRHPMSPEESIDERETPRPADPADRVTLDDNVRIALQVVLERLTAAERTTFVLHDVFQYPFESIAEIVGRSPAACRQLASRARRAIQADASSTRFAVEPAEQRQVTERFIAACTSGDIDALLEVLDPDVSGGADVGATLFGRDDVAAGVLRYLGPDSATTVLSLPARDRAVLVVLRGERVGALLTLTIEGERIVHFDVIAHPARLAPIGTALGA